MMRFRRQPRQAQAGATIFFATDLHGSNVCFRKFLSAMKAYEADLLVLGGDITGKLAVPIVESDGGKVTVYGPGGPRELSRSGLEDTIQQFERAGFYPFQLTRDELESFHDAPERIERMLLELMIARLELWSEWADSRLPDGAEILVAPGNDDPFEIDDALKRLPRFRLAEGQVIKDALPQLEIQIASTGFSNRTPWKTHRELDEAELADRLRTLIAGIDDPRTAILNVHVPPYGSTLDDGPIIDPETLASNSGVGADVKVPVGSTAVRDVLDEVQPMLSLHGHIHESRGIAKLGTTVAINPGSDYSDGVLRGALIHLDEHGVVDRYQLTTG